MALFSEPLPELILWGPKVYIRPPRRGDFLAWSRLREASRAFLVPWEPSWPNDAVGRGAYRRRLRRMAQDWREDSGYAFHVFRREDDVLIGGVAYSRVIRGVAQMASVGYWIGAPFAQHGYMTEALSLLIRFGFADLALHRIEAACLPHNTPSRALLRRCGFSEEGVARRYLKINGEWEDHVLYSLLLDDLA